MLQFKLLRDKDGEVTDQSIQMTDHDGTVWLVPNNMDNRFWREYQAWLALDNEPEEADEE